MDTTKVIAMLNDKFRKSGVDVVLTAGASTLNIEKLLQEVKDFSTFTQSNDPYGEHDFGTIYHGRDIERGIEGKKVFWKIDYYDKKLEKGESPISQNCRRILTIMLASEY